MEFQMWQFENDCNYHLNYAAVKGISSLHRCCHRDTADNKLTSNRMKKKSIVAQCPLCKNCMKKGCHSHVNNIHDVKKCDNKTGN